jgi:hypothetical protein
MLERNELNLESIFFFYFLFMSSHLLSRERSAKGHHKAKRIFHHLITLLCSTKDVFYLFYFWLGLKKNPLLLVFVSYGNLTLCQRNTVHCSFS